MDHDSSDEEDVFFCGRCKENFSSMKCFMEHKKNQSCRRVKHRHMGSQQQNQLSLASGMPMGLSGQITEDSTRENIQESTSPTAAQESDLNPVLTANNPGYSPQSSVARLQDVLTLLQGGQQMLQIDTSSGASDPQDSQSLMHVFERILTSSQNANLPTASRGQENPSSVDSDIPDNIHAQETSGSDLADLSSTLRESENVTSEIVLKKTTENESIGKEDSRLEKTFIPEEIKNGSAGVACSIEEQPMQRQRSGRQRLPRGIESKDGSTERHKSQAESSSVSKISVEVVDTTEAVMCKFCTETMTNGDGLFNHYMEVHNMKSGAALEFLGQSAFKKKRGRPPKRLAGKRCKPICCPHCGVSFNSKTLCAAHIRKHHRNKGTSSASNPTNLPSGRRRKCSRCGFQTTTAKDLTAHIHSSHSNKPQSAETVSEVTSKEKTNSIKTTQSERKTKTQRGPKRIRRSTEHVVTIEQDVSNNDNGIDVDDSHQEEAEDDEEQELEDEQETNYGSGKTLVKCPGCHKKMCLRGLKRHQVRCANKNRYVCPLCQHKSRESYDHTVHVDNHKIWVKAQASWLDNKSTGSQSNATVTTEAASCIDINPLGPLDSNSMLQSDTNKIDYATTVDLEAFGLIIQPENNLLQQNQELLAPGTSRLAEQDLQKSELSDVSLPPKGADTDTNGTKVSLPVEQESNCIDGGDKKLHPKDLKCKICYTWFSRTSLPKHMLQVHSLVKRFQCREVSCQLVFAKLEDFKMHVSSHSTENMFRCGCRGCVKRRLITPETMDNLRKEKMREYYKHMSHKCSKCWVKFPSQGSLDRHMKRESHIHPCSVCDKIQVSKRQLRMHMVTHQAERAYLCEVCGQNFKTKRDLNKHTFSHNNIRPHECPKCAKCFSFRNKMNRHMETVHSSKKPFTCDWPGCDKAFSRKDKLVDHHKTHLVSYPFKCQYCAKGFYRKDNLKDHEILHTRDFPFRCMDCNRGFMRPKILERHRLTEHAAVTTQITLQASITQDAQSDSPAQSISYVLCEPYVYANIDQLTSFQDNVQEADVQLMQGQRATIEAIQNAAAAVIGNGQSQFQIDGF